MFEVSYDDVLLVVLVCAFLATGIRGYRLQREFYNQISELHSRDDARRFEAMAATQMKLALLGGTFVGSALALFLALLLSGQLSVIGGVAMTALLAGNSLLSRAIKPLEKKLVQLPATAAELEARRDYLVHVWHKRLWPNFAPYAETPDAFMPTPGAYSRPDDDLVSKRDSPRMPVIHMFGALIIAAATIPVLMGLLTHSSEFARSTFLVSAAHAALALPLVLIFRHYNRLNTATTVCSGFLLGIVPIGIWIWPLGYGDGAAAGWLSYAQAILPFGVFGAVSGAAFWMVLKGLRSADTGPRWVGLGAGALAVALLVLPILTKDRSCHNLFRDGRNHIRPMLSIDLNVEEANWGAVHAFYQRFSENNRLDFNGTIDRASNHVSLLSLSMCREPGLHVRTNEQEWYDSEFAFMADRGISISLFQTSEAADWQQLARPLVEELNREFPNRVRYRNGDGELVPVSETGLAKAK